MARTQRLLRSVNTSTKAPHLSRVPRHASLEAHGVTPMLDAAGGLLWMVKALEDLGMARGDIRPLLLLRQPLERRLSGRVRCGAVRIGTEPRLGFAFLAPRLLHACMGPVHFERTGCHPTGCQAKRTSPAWRLAPGAAWAVELTKVVPATLAANTTT
jgi:hypothetical protein